jgi:hypothetical protein
VHPPVCRFSHERHNRIFIFEEALNLEGSNEPVRSQGDPAIACDRRWRTDEYARYRHLSWRIAGGKR